MKAKHLIIVLIPAVLFFIRCGTPPAPEDYIHTTAGFKFTVTAGWNKADEDKERYEFRQGNYKLVEVGGFDLEVKPEELTQLNDELTGAMLKESTMGGLEGYCTEAHIKNYSITEEGSTTWCGLPAYKVKAKGYSDEVSASVTVDIIVALLKSKARMYMFSSQIVDSEYSKVQNDLQTMIASFQLLP